MLSRADDRSAFLSKMILAAFYIWDSDIFNKAFSRSPRAHLPHGVPSLPTSSSDGSKGRSFVSRTPTSAAPLAIAAQQSKPSTLSSSDLSLCTRSHRHQGTSSSASVQSPFNPSATSVAATACHMGFSDKQFFFWHGRQVKISPCHPNIGRTSFASKRYWGYGYNHSKIEQKRFWGNRDFRIPVTNWTKAAVSLWSQLCARCRFKHLNPRKWVRLPMWFELCSASWWQKWKVRISSSYSKNTICLTYSQKSEKDATSRRPPQMFFHTRTERSEQKKEVILYAVHCFSRIMS